MLRPPNTHFGAVRVYTLADPFALAASAPLIAAELFGMRDLADGERTFSVNPTSGYLFYADYGELWHNDAGGGLPADPGGAERLARGFFADANRKIVGNRRLRRERVPALFPADLRPFWMGRAVPKSSTVPDHWLCQFAVYLAAGRNITGRVEGATIEVRIGRAGRIIGLSSRWRPLSGDLLSDEPADPAASKPLSAAPAGAIRKPVAGSIPPIARPAPSPIAPAAAEPEPPPEYLFWLADESAPQRFLAPVLLHRDGHGGELEPASAHSLRVEILQRSAGGAIEVLAVVEGGSGKYEYQWGAWRQDTFFDEGLQLLGTSQTASLAGTHHNVLLHVRDPLTGAVAQSEAVVIPGE